MIEMTTSHELTGAAHPQRGTTTTTNRTDSQMDKLTIDPNGLYQVDQLRNTLGQFGFDDKIVGEAILNRSLTSFRAANSQQRFVTGANLLNWLSTLSQV